MVKKVLIVNAGGFGSLSAEKGDYDEYIESIKRRLEVAERENGHTGKKEKRAEVQVTENPEEAEERTSRGEVDVLIFVTRGLLVKAEKIAAAYPRTEVFLLTGLHPEGTVHILEKSWFGALDPEDVFL